MLLKVLRQHDLKGLGAILLDDIQVKIWINGLLILSRRLVLGISNLTFLID